MFSGKRSQEILFSGNYSSFQEARKLSKGYDCDEILNRVRAAAIRVKEGQSLCERDASNLDQIPYSFPVLATLLRMALENEGTLNLVDFGGSLGSLYYQYQSFLGAVRPFRWNVVEQSHFVQCGRREFEDEVLKFYESLDECLARTRPNILLVSGSLQYLPDPHAFLEDALSRNFEYILFDRISFLRSVSVRSRTGPDLLTIQTVPPKIYDASYPAWFLDERKFKAHFQGKYEVLLDFDSYEFWNMKDFTANNRGYWFRKIRA